MSFKPFFHHHNRGTGKMPNRLPRGFTLYIRPLHDNEARNEETVNNINRDIAKARMCVVSGTFCSPKDQYNKAEGRLRAEAGTAKVINKRDLPRLVAACEVACEGWDADYVGDRAGDYNYLLKYVI